MVSSGAPLTHISVRLGEGARSSLAIVGARRSSWILFLGLTAVVMYRKRFPRNIFSSSSRRRSQHLRRHGERCGGRGRLRVIFWLIYNVVPSRLFRVQDGITKFTTIPFLPSRPLSKWERCPLTLHPPGWPDAPTISENPQFPLIPDLIVPCNCVSAQETWFHNLQLLIPRFHIISGV